MIEGIFTKIYLTVDYIQIYTHMGKTNRKLFCNSHHVLKAFWLFGKNRIERMPLSKRKRMIAIIKEVKEWLFACLAFSSNKKHPAFTVKTEKFVVTQLAMLVFHIFLSKNQRLHIFVRPFTRRRIQILL